jgi:hypothetical protein
MKDAFEQEAFPLNKKVRHYRPRALRRQRQKRRGCVRLGGPPLGTAIAGS